MRGRRDYLAGFLSRGRLGSFLLWWLGMKALSKPSKFRRQWTVGRRQDAGHNFLGEKPRRAPAKVSRQASHVKEGS